MTVMLIGGNEEFHATVQNLIEDKYNKMYKLDRQTQAKAIEILVDYFNKNKAEANVGANKQSMH